MRRILFAAIVLGASPALAEEAADGEGQIGGARVEVRGGIERPNLSDTQAGTTYVAKLGSGFTYGGEFGYDVPVSDTITVGPYVGFDGGSADKCETYTDPGVNGTVCFKGNSNLSAGVRVAFVSPKTEFYVGVGYSSYNTDFTIRETAAVGGATLFSYSNNGSRGGLDASAGANFTIAKRTYIGVGMKIGEYGEFEGSGFKLQRFQGHVALGFRF